MSPRTRFLALGLLAAGLPAVLRRLQARHRYEQHNRQVYLALSYEQTAVAATRAGMDPFDFLHECRHHGATHVAIREDTLGSLLAAGALWPVPGAAPGRHRFVVAHADLRRRLLSEFAARFPHLVASETPDGLELGGELAALLPLGLGFDPTVFRRARATGLQLIAQPVSYPWPTPATIERTLAQAAELEATLIAFADDPVLGHEMHLSTTAAALRRHRLAFVYFPDSRHQRGDWFLAKTMAQVAAERVVPALRFTAAERDSTDAAGLAYRAALRAREGGIRLIFVDAFIGIHAMSPTDVWAYLDQLVHELGHQGFVIDLPPAHGPATPEAEATTTPPHHEHDPASPHAHSHEHEHAHHEHGRRWPEPLPLADLTGAIGAWLEQPWVDASPGAGTEHDLVLPLAGMALLALERVRPLSLPAALALTTAGYGLATRGLSRLDRPRQALEHTYTPSYRPKLLALAALTLGPATGTWAPLTAPVAGLLAAAATAAPDYALRIETVPTFHLDWTAPLAWHLLSEPPALLAGRRSVAVALALAALPLLWRSRLPADPIEQLSRSHPSGHTHHLSAARRLLGDLSMALSPQPLSKWAGLVLLALPAAGLPTGCAARRLFGLAATVGGIAAAGVLRQPARPIALSMAQVVRSVILTAPMAALSALVARRL